MRLITGLLAAACAAALTGCPNPNAIGVQIYGTVAVHAVSASSGQPVANALAAVNSTQTCRTDASGNCSIPQVPVGPQIVNVDAPGLHGSAGPITVQENQTSIVTVTLQPTS